GEHRGCENKSHPSPKRTYSSFLPESTDREDSLGSAGPRREHQKRGQVSSGRRRRRGWLVSRAAGLDAPGTPGCLVNGETPGQFGNLFSYAVLDLEIADVQKDLADPRADLLHLGFSHPARGHRWAAQADAAALHGRQRVEGNRILIYRDSGA